MRHGCVSLSTVVVVVFSLASFSFLFFVKGLISLQHRPSHLSSSFLFTFLCLLFLSPFPFLRRCHFLASFFFHISFFLFLSSFLCVCLLLSHCLSSSMSSLAFCIACFFSWKGCGIASIDPNFGSSAWSALYVEFVCSLSLGSRVHRWPRRHTYERGSAGTFTLAMIPDPRITNVQNKVHTLPGEGNIMIKGKNDNKRQMRKQK